MPDGLGALKTDPESRCVAGCYRCLLSYFNQPDHELIDRRIPEVLTFLTRLSFSEVKAVANPSTSPHDAEPLDLDGFQIPLIWRAARVAAVEDATAPPDLAERLAAKGIDLFRLPQEAEALASILERNTA